MSQVSDCFQIIDDDSVGEENVPVAKLCDDASLEVSTLSPAKRRRHIEMLVATIVILILSAIFQIPDGHRVAFPGLPNLPMPGMCLSKSLFGVSCPGCGMTRSFICIAHGHFTEAFEFNRMGPVLFVFLLLQFPYRIYGLKARRDYPLGRFVAHGTVWLLITMLFGNWILGFWW